jgi:hypothetical protein
MKEPAKDCVAKQGPHRRTAIKPRGEVAEERLRRLKESVSTACDAFFARRGMVTKWRWNA